MSTIDRQVGDRVRIRREELRMDVAEVATRMGIGVEAMRRLEDGAERISAVQLQVLCAELLITPEAIFAGIEVE